MKMMIPDWWLGVCSLNVGDVEPCCVVVVGGMDWTSKEVDPSLGWSGGSGQTQRNATVIDEVWSVEVR